MMRPACFQAMAIADRIESKVDEAERLRLDEHLATCARCSEDVTLLQGIARTARSVGELDAAARERALSRAFRAHASARHEVAATRGPGLRSGWFAVPAVAAVAAAAALFFGTQRGPSALALFPSTTSGGLHADVVAPVSSAAVRDIEIAAGESVALEGALATAIAPASVAWDAGEATAHVKHGSVRFEVTPGRSKPFVVVTERYRVDVLGTIFVVGERDVTVERGRVQIVPNGGSAAPALIGAGERWELDEPAKEAGAASSDSGAARAPQQDVRAVFSRARKHLAGGEHKQARRLVEQILSGSSLTAAQHAEAQTLLAECSLVAGDSKEAARRYAEVAKQHRDLPAGETALFAAARAAHKSGQSAEARRLLRQYLSSYPNGQFANEARTRLSQLAP
ncbi:MAG: hypothetical protein HOW73_43770 [Polyangiaceae bacterium]|nr:hypothetical protein [Polyangiaceae bacterium]